MRANPRRTTKAQNARMMQAFVDTMMKVMPDPKCELYYETNYQLLVSVILSAQTTDKMVNRCMEKPYQDGLGPEQVLKMGETKFRNLIKSIGLAPTKAKNVLKMTTILKHSHNSEVPDNREALEALPGVGRKTANVILGELFGHPTIAVDTHVYRVSRRFGWHNEKTPLKCEQKLLDLIPAKYLPKAHHWLILHGRYTCKAQKPACEECVVAEICPSFD